MEIAKDVLYVGVNDHRVDLFEGQYRVPNGMSYNSYVLLDEKIAVMDTVDRNFTREWLDNVARVLAGRAPDYLVVQHMEPDHSASIRAFMDAYPKAVVVASAKAFPMMEAFFGTDFSDRSRVVKEGDVLELGRRSLQFVMAPMVHWPEVMVTYDAADGVLFTADGFGKFGALDVLEPWEDEARRYYIGIVGKYGPQVQALLRKAAALDIKILCPLHGPVLRDNLAHYISLYQKWSSYQFEEEGIVVAYSSVYGHTKAAVDKFVDMLHSRGCPKIAVHDLARCDMAQAVADAFRYSKIVLATTTYNADVFPCMKEYIHHLLDRNFQGRTVGLIENGSWAPMAAKTMKSLFEKSKNVSFADNTVTIRSALNAESEGQLAALADELCRDYEARKNLDETPKDLTALFKIGYGLYVVTSHDGTRDNGLIVNTVSQVTNTPNRVAVTINKTNYSHDVIRKTGKMNVNCLNTDAPFSVFERFGFQSGRNADKFAGFACVHTANGLAMLSSYINAMISLEVEQYVDLDTHGMFICRVTESRVLSDRETMTYTYYQQNVKPKPQTEGKKGYVCTVCGYVYEGDTLPDDFVCPLCKHGPADFEEIK